MLLDTSAWIELRAQDPGGRAQRVWGAAGDGPFYCSPVQFGEMSDIAIRRGEDVGEFVAGLHAALCVPLTHELALQASRLKAEARARPEGKAFSLIDGILLASAREAGVPLLTLDADFAGFEDCIILGDD